MALAGLLLLLLSVVPYINSLRNGFVWDDQQQIVMNPDLRKGVDWGRLFSAGVWATVHKDSPAANIYYRPLQMTTYRMVVDVAGVSPVALHGISLLFAAGSVLLAFVLFMHLTGSLELAFAAAALFAVLPVHTEAVDWISALPDLGCTLLVLAAFLLYLPPSSIKNSGPPNKRAQRWVPVGLSLACFVLALLWKETAVVLPLLIAVYVCVVASEGPWPSRIRPAVLASLPYWVLFGGYLLLRLQLLGAIAGRQRNWQLSPLQLALTIPWLMAQYWWKLLVPFPLNAYRLFEPATSLLDPRALAGLAFVALAATFLIVAARRWRLACFSAAWVILCLLPVMNIDAVGRNVVAERYLYLPSVGYCLLVVLLAAAALQRVPEARRRLVGGASLAVLVILFAGITVARNRDWQDNATLFGRTLERSPNAPFVQVMVAAAAAEQVPQSADAEEHYQKAASSAAAETPPDRVNMGLAYKGLAAIYNERADYSRALEMLARARDAAPDDVEIDGEQGLILTKAGRWDEAAVYLQRAAGHSAEDANVLNALGIYEQQRNKELAKAAAYFQQALNAHTAQDSFAASVHNNLGTVYGEQGRYSDAIDQFKAALAIVPLDMEYHMNLATALAANGDYTGARAEVQGVLAANPNYEPAKVLLQQLATR